MDRETVLNQLGAIEDKIEHVMMLCKRLNTDNTELRRQNELLNSQLKEKIETEKLNEEIKGIIRTRIDSLMGRLDEFTEE